MNKAFISYFVSLSEQILSIYLANSIKSKNEAIPDTPNS